MKNIKKILAILIAVALSGSFGTNSEAQNKDDDIIVIVNKRVPINSISAGELKMLFLKKRTNWSDGSRIVLVHAKSNTDLRRKFLEKVMDMTQKKERLYWQNQKIQRGITGPTEFVRTQKSVFFLKGSIGYMWRRDYKEGVTKSVLVIPD